MQYVLTVLFPMCFLLLSNVASCKNKLPLYIERQIKLRLALNTDI